MFRIAYLAALAAFFLVPASGCSTGTATGGGNQELTVFAASSLTQAFQDIDTSFQRENPDVAITYNFAGSQQLRTQLEHGAQADVFASADWRQMNAVVDAGLVTGEPAAFVSNTLVVIAFADNRKVSSLEDLSHPGVKVVVAQPEVPAGAYSRAVIDALTSAPQYGAKFTRQLLSNIVSEETNVRTVAHKVALGEADAGIVYRTDAIVADIAEHTRVIPIPEQFNVTASYPIVTLSGSARPDLARRFSDFVISDQGQQIFSRYGFSPAGTGGSPPDRSDLTDFNGR